MGDPQVFHGQIYNEEILYFYLGAKEKSICKLLSICVNKSLGFSISIYMADIFGVAARGFISMVTNDMFIGIYKNE